MTHSHTPLTHKQKVVGSGEVLGSGEANYYDLGQNPSGNLSREGLKDANGNPIYDNYKLGSGIIASYRSPANFSYPSGTVFTPGASGNIE